MIVMASRVTVQPSVYSDWQQTNKHQRSALLSLCEGNPLVTSGLPHKGTVTRKMFSFDDVIIMVVVVVMGSIQVFLGGQQVFYMSYFLDCYHHSHFLSNMKTYNLVQNYFQARLSCAMTKKHWIEMVALWRNMLRAILVCQGIKHLWGLAAPPS